METHAIYFDGILRATVTVRSPIELCTIVATMRDIIDGPGHEFAVPPNISEVTSTLLRIR